MFIGKFNRTVIVTYLGILSFIIGAYYSLFEHNIAASVVCLLISGVCDMFDGKIARMCKRTDEQKEFGVQIDSLADIVAFTISPLIIFYGYIMKYEININPILIITASTVLIVCGITRLAYFNIKASEGPVKYYSGLPVTLSAVIFPFVYLLGYVIKNHEIIAYIYLATIFLVSFLYVLNFKFKKPTSKFFYIIIPILALIFGLIFMFI